MTTRSVLEHALTVYYDGDAVLAGKVIDQHEHALAEQQRAWAHGPHWVTALEKAAVDHVAALIDPEVST